MRKRYIINMEDAPKAKLSGKYLFVCLTCVERDSFHTIPIQTLVPAKILQFLKAIHDVRKNHSWVILHESVLPRYHIDLKKEYVTCRKMMR